MRISGSESTCEPRIVTRAAPVGVVSSRAGPAARHLQPFSSPSVAGAGTGSTPWAQRTPTTSPQLLAFYLAGTQFALGDQDALMRRADEAGFRHAMVEGQQIVIKAEGIEQAHRLGMIAQLRPADCFPQFVHRAHAAGQG